MPMETYRDYFDIDPEYFSAVNEEVIRTQPDVWKQFFPHETFVKLLKNVINVLDRKQKLSIWVEGSYGTGKSHAVLTLKKLLDADEADTREYFERYNLDKDLCNNLQRIKTSGEVLTVHRYGSSNIHGDNDLFLAIQESVEMALESEGIENQASYSLKESVIRYLSDEENKQSFNVYVEGSYKDLFGGDDIDTILNKLKTYTDNSLRLLMEKIFKVASERQIRAFQLTAKDLCNWLKEVIHANNLKSIVFIWDEFTEYFKANARSLTGFQEIAELSETKPFYFIIVTHGSEALFNEMDPDFKKINDRFVKPHSVISLPENIAFQLIGAAMKKNEDSAVAEDWKAVTGDLESMTADSRKAVQKIARISDKEMLDILPIHPYTALLLKHISSVFDSNQRSMFDFIKNNLGDEGRGFQWFIDNYGPYGENPFLTIDMLWEFFYDKGRDLLPNDVRSILDYYTRTRNQKLDKEEKKVLKAVLLLQSVSNRAGDAVELFTPNEKNIELAFEGSDLDGVAASRCADKLVRDKVLFKKSLGSGKFQYNAYINEVDSADLEKYKAEIDKKTTSSFLSQSLNDNSYVSSAVSFEGAIKLRYEFKYVAANDFDSAIKFFRNREPEMENKIAVVVCFAKDDAESVAIGKKIKSALQDGSYHNIFIDATLTPFGKDGYEQYRENMAQSMYYSKPNGDLSVQYLNNAKDELKKWKDRIQNGEFIVYTSERPLGERATSIDALIEILKKINKEKFPRSPESFYNVIPTLFTANSLKLGVECGATRKTKGLYSSSNVNTKLETALKEAWDEPRYWEKYPNILISQIKRDVDKVIKEGFDRDGRISISEVYDVVKAKPYGFMPCNLSAFLLGFILSDYTDGTYSWSDDLTNDVLNVEKLKEMVDGIIKQYITPNARYKNNYIVMMTEKEKTFNEVTSAVFNIPLNVCTSFEQTRDRVRNEMKKLSFPIWTLKYVIRTANTKTDKKVLCDIIDCYYGLANSNNMGTVKSEKDYANKIGELCLEYQSAKEDLCSIISKNNCIEGMKIYIREFEDGQLVKLSQEVGDNGQYINVLRNKFDADAANWVWNIDTAQQKIREVILEYCIIAESNKVIQKNTDYKNTIKDWCDKCRYIRIAYLAAKDFLGDISPFVAMLYDLKRTGTLPDSKKEKFLDLLINNAQGFKNFYDNQTDVFKNVCSYYLDGLSDQDIVKIYQSLPTDRFTDEKGNYLSMVDSKVKEYKKNLGYEKLKNLWKQKTNSSSPKKWSMDHSMPILAVIPDNEVQTAKKAFDAINKNTSNETAIKDALNYIENATFYDVLNDEDELNRIFKESIIKNYSVLLTDIDEVKNELRNRISVDPYEWFGLPEVDRKIKQMAEAKYIQDGSSKALEKIDNMDVSEVKRYLKELIKDNMIVGIEIIKDN